MDWKYENGRIYTVDDKGDLLCETTFSQKKNGAVNINHTYVHPVLRGQGQADKMMEVVAEYLRKEGLKATATCSYANLWLKNHAETYADIIPEEKGKQ